MNNGQATSGDEGDSSPTGSGLQETPGRSPVVHLRPRLSDNETGSNRPLSRPSSAHFEEAHPSARPRPLSSIPELGSLKSIRTAPSDGELPMILRTHQSIVTFLLAEKHISTVPAPKNIGVQGTVWETLIASRVLMTIILGQFVVLAAAWAFFIVLAFKGPLALPFSAALMAKDNPHLLTLVVTLIATIMSAISSYLFSLSIRYAMAYYLARRSMTLFTLASSIKILNRNLVFNTRHPKATIASLFTLIVTSTLIAAWSTLIMPVPITTASPFNGQELDITNDALIDTIFNANSDLRTIDSTTVNSVSLHLSGLGLARAAENQANSVLPFKQWTFNPSSGGILPSQGIPATTRPGFSAAYIVHSQQGFTATVSCQYQDLSTALTEASTSVDVSALAAGMGPAGNGNTSRGRIYVSRWSTTCGGGTYWSDPYYSWTNNTIVGLPCPDDGTNGYNFWIKANGRHYQSIQNIACTISPQITTLEADYSEEGDVNIRSSVISQGASVYAIASYAIAALQRRFVVAQSMSSNDVGDAILGLVEEVGNASADTTLRIMEAYLRGHIEFSATLLRSAVASSGLSAAQPSSSSSIGFRSTSGTYLTSTIGFEQLHPAWINIVLVPITLVCLASLILVSVVLVQRAREGGESAAHSSVGEAADDRSFKEGTPTPAFGPDRTSRYSMPGLSVFSNDRRASAAPTFFTAHSQDSEARSGVDATAPGAATALLSQDVANVERKFDIGDPFHLLAVASAGGLATFDDAEGAEDKDKGEIYGDRVRLGRVSRQGMDSQIGLIRTI